MSDKEAFTEQDWRRLLTSLGEDPDRPGLHETPARVAKAWKHWTSGYGQDPVEVLKAFEDGAEQYNELIVVRGIPVYSHCEHHLAPCFGKATVGYVPNGKIVGLSKLTRLVDCFAKRLQVQERMTMQIANALLEVLATDPSTERDIPKFCHFLRHELVSQSRRDDDYVYVIRKG